MQPNSDQITDVQWQWSQFSSGLTTGNAKMLEAAFLFASETHDGQWRKSAEGASKIPYIIHPIRVARILSEEWGRKDGKILAAALLHDVLEDGELGKQDANTQKILDIAGRETLQAVQALTKFPLPASVTEEMKNRREADYFRVLRASEEWVRLVKCADRADNLRDAQNWGEINFWRKYCSETIGWHLQLARETSPMAEVALFKALVDGERLLSGRVPVWADGHIIDPHASSLIPEHIAVCYNAVGISLQGKQLVVGLSNLDCVADVTVALHATSPSISSIVPIKISESSIKDALKAGLYGAI